LNRVVQNTKNSYNLFEALTPLDGRNRRKLSTLIPFFTDFALNKYRMIVEIKYFVELSKIGVIRKLEKSEMKFLDELIDNFNEDDYLEIVEIESRVNHDIKALELFIQDKLKNTTL
jgi:adenylosuccinate lyase